MGDLVDRVKVLEESAIDQETRSRRNNLLFHGIKKEESEDCLKTVKLLVKEKCGITKDVIVERAHRIGPVRRGVVGAT